MPHMVPANFALTRKYFLDNEDVLIDLTLVKTLKVLGSCIYFYGGSRKVLATVDFYAKELAMKEFNDIVSTIYKCVEWRKKNE